MNKPLSSIASIVGTTSLIASPVLARRLGAARAVTLVSTALTMGMSFAHTLEIPGKRSYDGRLWWHLSRTLYRPWWGRAGQLEGVALGAAPALAYLVRDRRPAYGLTVAASAFLLTANPLVFFRFVRPANLATLRHTPDQLPADWQHLRDQWEYGHAARFALHLLAFTALVASVLDDTPAPEPHLQPRAPARKPIG